MVAAMAYRVKYSKVCADGKPLKMAVRVEEMGVHKKNRGSVYPAGIRCKSLCTEVVEAGFMKEEISHACVVVEEPPIEELIRSQTSTVFESALTYNQSHCSKDEILVTCFQAPYDVVRVNNLAHNHIMLVLRAFATRAKWDLPVCEEKGIIYCDVHGKLSITAVAGSRRGLELSECLAEWGDV